MICSDCARIWRQPLLFFRLWNKSRYQQLVELDRCESVGGSKTLKPPTSRVQKLYHFLTNTAYKPVQTSFILVILCNFHWEKREMRERVTTNQIRYYSTTNGNFPCHKLLVTCFTAFLLTFTSLSNISLYPLAMSGPCHTIILSIAVDAPARLSSWSRRRTTAAK